MIFRYFDRKIWSYVIIATVLMALSIYLSAQIPAAMDRITDSFNRGDTDAVLENARGMAVYAFISFIIVLFAGVSAARASSMLTARIRMMEFEATRKMLPQDVDHFSVSSLSTRSTGDVEAVSGFVISMITSGISLPLTLIVVLPPMMGSAKEFNIVLLILLSALALIITLAIRRITVNIKRIQVLNDGMNRSFLEYLEGLLVIRAYNGEKKHEAQFGEASTDVGDNIMDLQRHYCYIDPLVSSFTILIPLCIYATAYFTFPALAPDVQMESFGKVLSYTMYALMLMSALTDSVSLFGLTYPKYVVSKNRIDQVIDYRPTIEEGSSVNDDKSGTVEFENVTFAYPGTDETVLHNISFKVGKGQHIALIGATACGKTTLLNLIMRYYDTTSGSVKVDGMDVRDYSFTDLYERLSYCPQQPFVFSRSIRDNIRFGKKSRDVSDEELEGVLKDCGILEFSDRLTNGVDTVLSGGGRDLSGGQRQRVSIARAVCSTGEIYIFDDCFSALDAKTDVSVRNAIRERLEDCTVITVTQRVSSVRDADVIYVMDAGRIIASGNHDELMRSCEYYSDLVHMQSDREVLS